jgi:hypothetical protein
MKFKQSQKFRVIVSGVSVYVTAKQIKWGIGDQIGTNRAVYEAFAHLKSMNSKENSTLGLCGNFVGIPVQITTL